MFSLPRQMMVNMRLPFVLCIANSAHFQTVDNATRSTLMSMHELTHPWR